MSSLRKRTSATVRPSISLRRNGWRETRKGSIARPPPSLNQWGLVGSWNVGPEAAVLQVAPGKLVFRFHSRDLNLILAPTKDGKPVRFKVTLDGAAPGENNGVDSAPDGGGGIREPRMYQLIRQKGPIEDRTFEIEFLDPGVQALDFTFGRKFSLGCKEARPLCQNCARIRSFHAIGVSFERKADSPN